uniref:hypothetical protein n=1 Tax=Edaphosphingomonas laterariae TaxID=861865 RepID=UPI0015C66096|nr:hypothetical protein [Sphingomonas laterariae]
MDFMQSAALIFIMSQSQFAIWALSATQTRFCAGPVALGPYCGTDFHSQCPCGALFWSAAHAGAARLTASMAAEIKFLIITNIL